MPFPFGFPRTTDDEEVERIPEIDKLVRITHKGEEQKETMTPMGNEYRVLDTIERRQPCDLTTIATEVSTIPIATLRKMVNRMIDNKWVIVVKS